MQTHYLVCYDIADEGRLARVHRYLKGVGVPMQYSVFLCSWTWSQYQEALSHLVELIDPQADDVRLYPLPSGHSIASIGSGDRTPEGAMVMLP
ncbi:MAG: CRISPR-associated endonuclease Cas2 [Nitrospira sp.]|nr:CRISPR-associated endonuclease Cas2 [Nitrospira sp.]MCP9462915.1 CRISPR-associated endonuclease Cas2 [Nitrospira sp.]MCP9475908.1 CRISPR-associated endonuclease Cas2 [Nitrospira sp.]